MQDIEVLEISFRHPRNKATSKKLVAERWHTAPDDDFEDYSYENSSRQKYHHYAELRGGDMQYYEDLIRTIKPSQSTVSITEILDGALLE
jgi:hypothetical protein